MIIDEFRGVFGFLLTWANAVSMRGPEKGGGKGVNQKIGRELFRLIQVFIFKVSIIWCTKLRMNASCWGVQ